MKTRRLPDTDLARITVQPIAHQWISLRTFKLGKPSFGYNPVRMQMLDLFNAQMGFLPASPGTPFEKIEELLLKDCRRGEEEFLNNLAIAKAVRRMVDQEELSARRHPFGTFSLRIGDSAKYWENAILRKGSKFFVPFCDLRRKRGITVAAQKFLFSMMHEHIRVPDPDFAEAGLALVKFPNGEGNSRGFKLMFSDEADLIPYDELNDMIATTYSIWAAVLKEREEAAKSAAAGDPFSG